MHQDSPAQDQLPPAAKAALERHKQALRVADQAVDLPPEVNESFKGPSEAITALLRGTVLGAAGYFLGRGLSHTTASPYTPFPVNQQSPGYKTLAYGLGAAGAILGLHSGSVQVRETKKQVSRMQRAIEAIYEQNRALKSELKAQLLGEGSLHQFDPAWEKAQTANQQGDAGAPTAAAAPVLANQDSPTEATQDIAAAKPEEQDAKPEPEALKQEAATQDAPKHESAHHEIAHNDNVSQDVAEAKADAKAEVGMDAKEDVTPEPQKEAAQDIAENSDEVEPRRAVHAESAHHGRVHTHRSQGAEAAL